MDSVALWSDSYIYIIQDIKNCLWSCLIYKRNSYLHVQAVNIMKHSKTPKEKNNVFNAIF